MNDEINESEDAGETPKRGRVTNAELLERMEAIDARMADLDARERELSEREEAFKAQALAPREREMSQEGRSRAHDDTAHMERLPMDFYAPPGQLEVPKSQQYYYRWIAESVNGMATPTNVQKRIREGFERVKMQDLPEDFIVDEDHRGDGFARNSGLILMRIPHQKKAAIDRYYLKKSAERLAGADELQGIAKRDYVREDRGSRTLSGRDAQDVLSAMSQS